MRNKEEICILGWDEKNFHWLNRMNIGTCGGQELWWEPRGMQAEKEAMTLLPALADIFLSDGYEFVESETVYRETMKNIGKRVIGFQQKRGYVSFDPAYMCNLIAQWMEEEAVSENCLQKELSHYHLVYTEGQYYHVHLRRLIELINGKEGDEAWLVQEYIGHFEQCLRNGSMCAGGMQ